MTIKHHYKVQYLLSTTIISTVQYTVLYCTVLYCTVLYVHVNTSVHALWDVS